MNCMRLVGACLVVVSLLACRPEPAQEAPEPENAVNAAAPAGPEADLNASLEEVAGLEPPPRFIGRWAAEERLCADAAWVVGDTVLETPAGSVCRFIDVEAVPGGYDIVARCTAEGPERDDRLRLRFPESGGGMTFESYSIADAGLVRCGG